MTDTKNVAYVRKRLCKATDVFDEIFVKTKEISAENEKLKTENKWYSEQLNEAVKEIAQFKELIQKDKSTIYDLKSILERMNYGGAEYDALKQIIHDFETDINRYEMVVCND